MPFDLLAAGQMYQQAGDRGRNRYADKLLGQAVAGANPEAQQQGLARLAGAGFGGLAMDAGTALENRAGAQEDRAASVEKRKRESLVRNAQFILNAPEPMRAGVYAQMQPTLASFGLQAPPQYGPEVEQAARAIVSAWGDDATTNLPSSVREAMAFRDDPSLLATRRQMYGSYSYGEVPLPDGTVAQTRRNSRTGEMEMVLPNGDVRPMAAPITTPGSNYAPTQDAPRPSAPQSYASADPEAVQMGLIGLVGNGVTMTSGFRTKADNDRVDGKPNSRHLRGQAGDFIVPERLKAEWTARANAAGFKVIDEGDHMHAQWMGQQAAPVAVSDVSATPGVGGGGSAGNVPAGSPAPTGAGFGVTTVDKARQDAEAAALKVNAEETMRRQLALEYAPEEATAAADAARQKKEAELLAERNAATDKRASQAADTVTTLNDALAILPEATGGVVDQAVDAAGRAVNKSTEGSRATARLKLLAAKLIANVPRFEGPQSNIDVKFYREAAGDLANPDLSVGERQAAAELMLEIAQRYAKQGAAPASPPTQGGGWGITRVK